MGAVNTETGETIWGSPADESKKTRWPQYSDEIFASSCSPDLVLVDGRFRVACAVKSFHRLTAGGRLLIHDYHRTEYHPIEGVFEKVEQVSTLGIFKKKEDVPAFVLDELVEKFEYDYR